MGADNWAECPRCRRRREEGIRNRLRLANEAYGAVPIDEWKALDAAARLIPEPTYTFREDYEIGVVGSEVVVSYGGGCTVCGLQHDITQSFQIEGIEQ